MKKVLLILLTIYSSNISIANNIKKEKMSKIYKGTINGILILKSENNKEIILDFQGSKAKKFITPDISEVYAKYYFSYIGTTTSGKTNILFRTYFEADEFGILLNGITYSVSTIDGTCEAKINGINYNFYNEKEREYLIITFSENIKLSTMGFPLINLNDVPNFNYSKNVNKKIIIDKNSVLLFAIN
jgi:hypothetical protein